MSDFSEMARSTLYEIEQNKERLHQAEEFLRSLPDAPAAQHGFLRWDAQLGQILLKDEPWCVASNSDLYYYAAEASVTILVREVVCAASDRMLRVVGA